MQDTDLLYTPVWQLRQLLDDGRVSSVELTELYLGRIGGSNWEMSVKGS